MSTGLSVEFRFMEWRSYVVNCGNSSKWVPDMTLWKTGGVSKCCQEIQNKWVYLFRLRGTELIWNREYLVKDGLVHEVPNPSVNRGQAQDKWPAPAKPGGQTTRLPHTINKDKVYYFGIVSRVRLHENALENLRKPVLKLLPGVDVGMNYMWSDGPTAHQLLIGKSFVFPCVDPLTIAENLSAEYRQAADALIKYTCAYKDQSDAEAKTVKERNQKKLLGSVLKSVLDADPADKLDLRDEFAEGAEAKMRAFLMQHDADINKLTTERNLRAAALCEWMDSALIDETKNAYFLGDKVSCATFINAYGASADRLIEAPPGQKFLFKLLDSPTHFVHEYALRTTKAPETKFQIGRLCASSILTLWKELADAHIIKKGNAVSQILAFSLTCITHKEILIVQTTANTTLVVTKTRKTVVLAVSRFTLNQEAPAMMATWMQDSHPVGKVLTRLTMFVEILNLGLTLKAVRTADPGRATVQAAMAAIGSSVSLLSAIGSVLEFGKKPLYYLGGVAAAFDAICATFDTFSAIGNNDYWAAAGYASGGFGSVLFALGSYCSATGIGASATGAGIPPGAILIIVGAILSAAGWIVATFATRSELELLVGHCVWGVDYGDGSASPKWAGGTFSSWNGDLERQLSATFNLLCAFRLVRDNFKELTIFMGMVTPTSRFHVKYWCIDEPPVDFLKPQPQLRVNVGEQSWVAINGKHPELGYATFGKQNGQRYAKVHADYPVTISAASSSTKESEAPNYWTEKIKGEFSVQLDLYGDGKYIIPGLSKWVTCKTKEVSSTSY